MQLASKERRETIWNGPQITKKTLTFTASLDEINQALRPRARLTGREIEAALTLAIRYHWKTCMLKEGSELLPY